jgi:hypothetical protein
MLPRALQLEQEEGADSQSLQLLASLAVQLLAAVLEAWSMVSARPGAAFGKELAAASQAMAWLAMFTGGRARCCCRHLRGALRRPECVAQALLLTPVTGGQRRATHHPPPGLRQGAPLPPPLPPPPPHTHTRTALQSPLHPAPL